MKKGRVTIPTNLDVVPQTLEILDEWGADAIRDCDGTEFPKELKDTGSKIYATYYTTRKDNEWAKAHPEEIQQMYIMTSFHTATEDKLEIHLMDHLYPDMLAVNTRDDIYRWWEVIDRTTGEPVSTELWSYEEETGNVVIRSAKLFHEYTVSFLAYIMWDPVHMYNSVVNDWKSHRSHLMCASQKQKLILWNVCADSWIPMNMWMLCVSLHFSISLPLYLMSLQEKNM
jgi:1,3-beta-galactosyl-N-acetylhexosamine phosphorylase